MKRYWFELLDESYNYYGVLIPDGMLTAQGDG